MSSHPIEEVDMSDDDHACDHGHEHHNIDNGNDNDHDMKVNPLNPPIDIDSFNPHMTVQMAQVMQQFVVKNCKWHQKMSLTWEKDQNGVVSQICLTVDSSTALQMVLKGVAAIIVGSACVYYGPQVWKYLIHHFSLDKLERLCKALSQFSLSMIAAREILIAYKNDVVSLKDSMKENLGNIKMGMGMWGFGKEKVKVEC